MAWYGIAVLVLIIIVALVILITWIKHSFTSGKPLGATCDLHTDCAGWGPDPHDNACCGNVCTEKIPDYINVGYCPNECKGCTSCALGTCGDYAFPRAEGEPCALHTDCAGWGPEPGAMACCSNVCTQKVRDYIGTGWCPNECRANPSMDTGTCAYDWSWPREQGEPCNVDSDCLGNWSFGTVACCRHHCVDKDVSVQTCDDYCGRHPDKCTAPYPK